MNRNEVEQWMKKSLDRRDYIPREDEWAKLREAIIPPSKKNSLFVIGALSAGWKVAASVVLIVTAGTIVHLLEGNNGKTDNNVAVTMQKPRSVASAKQKEDKELLINETSDPVRIVDFDQHRPANKRPERNTPTHIYPGLTSDKTIPGTEPPSEILGATKQQNDEKIATVPEEESLLPKPVQNNLKIQQDFIEKNAGFNNKFTVGIAAQAGRASVGNMRYQFGVVARKDFSPRFYTSATLAFASTNVTSAQQNTFQTVVVTSSVTTGTMSTVEETAVEARYSKDIVSIGVSPVIGYRLTKRLAVSAGFALHRNLDQSLSLRNEENIDPVAMSNNVVSDSKQISRWDAGVMGSASYNVSRKLAVDIQYRYGLSTYMYQGDQALRNSGVGLGLNYMFGRP